MAVVRAREGRSVPSRLPILPVLFLLVLSALPRAAGAMTQVLEGSGNFHSSVDVVNRWVAEDRLDVMVLFEVANGDLKFEEEDEGQFVARMRVEVRLESLDGEVITRKRQIRSPRLNAADAAAPAQYQVFGVLLEDVPFRAGRVACGVYDVNRRRAGLLNAMRKINASSECAGVWAAENGPRPLQGIALEEPLYLVQAPFDTWNPDVVAANTENDGWLHDYVHPARRYGLQQDRLQIYQPVWPQAGGIPADDRPLGLRVEVTNLDMDFAIRDTVVFDERGRMALAAGRPAGLFYELDVNLLPEGAYHLSMAPLDGEGRGSLTRFDVLWRLEAMARHRSLVLGEGRTVFRGKQQEEFLAASPAEQEAMLDAFWDARNPDPEAPFNEAYLEFQYRVAYVQKFFGGFDEFGAVDDRGEVFILLGPADEVQTRRMPRDADEQDDARYKVYDRLAPGSIASDPYGGPISAQNIQPFGALEAVPHSLTKEGIDRAAGRDRDSVFMTPAHNQPFEFWSYDRGGKPLFDSWLSDRGLGQRFLFIDLTSEGLYTLKSSNVLQPEE